VWEPTSGEGAAKVGAVEVETSKSGFGSAIESAIHSVLRAAGVNKVVRAMEQVIFSLGV
jgi:ribosomal protein S5